MNNEPDPYEQWLETGEYPDGAKSVRYAADAAMKAFMEYIADNLEH